jgi:hypothetical protein
MKQRKLDEHPLQLKACIGETWAVDASICWFGLGGAAAGLNAASLLHELYTLLRNEYKIELLFVAEAENRTPLKNGRAAAGGGYTFDQAVSYLRREGHHIFYACAEAEFDCCALVQSGLADRAVSCDGDCLNFRYHSPKDGDSDTSFITASQCIIRNDGANGHGLAALLRSLKRTCKVRNDSTCDGKLHVTSQSEHDSTAGGSSSSSSGVMMPVSQWVEHLPGQERAAWNGCLCVSSCDPADIRERMFKDEWDCQYQEPITHQDALRCALLLHALSENDFLSNTDTWKLHNLGFAHHKKADSVHGPTRLLRAVVRAKGIFAVFFADPKVVATVEAFRTETKREDLEEKVWTELRKMPIEELQLLAAEAGRKMPLWAIFEQLSIAACRAEDPEERQHLVSQVMAVRLQPEQQTSSVDQSPTSQPMGTYKVLTGLSGFGEFQLANKKSTMEDYIDNISLHTTPLPLPLAALAALTYNTPSSTHNERCRSLLISSARRIVRSSCCSSGFWHVLIAAVAASQSPS